MKLKKNIQLFIFTLVMLISSLGINVKASTFDNTLLDKYVTDYKELTTMNVDKNKEFYINFSKEMDYKTINSKSIKVINSKGEEIDVTPYITTGNKKVVAVRGPQGGYIEGETYALIVKKSALDINSKSLNKEIVMKFAVKNTSTQDTPNTDANKSETELFIENLYKTNSPYWNYGAKFLDGKLNLNYYDYSTKKSSWNTLSTIFNPDINTQTINVFKSLYTEKEGYQTCISYSDGNNNTGLSVIEFYGKGLTPWGEPFVSFMFFDSAKSTDKGTNFIVSIPKCTKDNYNNNSYIIKNALNAAFNNSYSDQIFNYINNQYTNTVLADNDEYIVISKTFGSFKVVVTSYNRSLYSEIIKL